MRHPVRVLAAPLVAVLVAAAWAPAAATEPATFAEAQTLAAAEGKPLLVDFFATW